MARDRAQWSGVGSTEQDLSLLRCREYGLPKDLGGRDPVAFSQPPQLLQLLREEADPNLMTTLPHLSASSIRLR